MLPLPAGHPERAPLSGSCRRKNTTRVFQAAIAGAACPSQCGRCALICHDGEQILVMISQTCELPSIHMQGVLGPGDTHTGVEAGTSGIDVAWQAESPMCGHQRPQS